MRASCRQQHRTYPVNLKSTGLSPRVGYLYLRQAIPFCPLGHPQRLWMRGRDRKIFPAEEELPSGSLAIRAAPQAEASHSDDPYHLLGLVPSPLSDRAARPLAEWQLPREALRGLGA